MHFDQSPKEKPSALTVKKLLEEKRRRGTPVPSPSSATAGPDPLSQQPSSSELFTCTGASNSYSEMAMSYEASWSRAPEASLSYYPGAHAGSSYAPAYSFPMTSDCSAQPQLPGFVDATSQAYQDCPMTVADPSLTSSWPVPCPGQAATLSFGSPLDRGRLEEARMMLRGLDDSRATGQDEDGDTILHIYTAKGLREYAYAAAERLRELDRLDAKEHKGKTALLVAVTANQTEIVQDLLSLGADINSCDVKGQTALHLAVHQGFPRVLEAILSGRPDINLEARNFEGMTALHCAVSSHCVTVKALSSGAGQMSDANLQAKAAEKLSCVRSLLKAGASVCSQEIKSNKTVLHLAVKEGNVELVLYLLGLPLANMREFVNMKAHGHTALHMAAGLHCSLHQREILQLLLDRGADPSVRNLENNQPARLLQSGQHGQQLRMMLKKRGTSSRRRNVSSQEQE